jgi:MFS family permease
VATYATFAAVAFFAGTIHNKLGVRKMLVTGGFGYAVSVSSYICYNHTGNQGFVVFGGALAGFCAALLWTAQGAVVMGYPSESAKGKFISLNWAIFNMGAVIGALVRDNSNLQTSLVDRRASLANCTLFLPDSSRHDDKRGWK